MSLDSTMDFVITGPGGNSSAPSTRVDSEMETPFGSKVSPSDAPGKNNVGSVSKGETPGKINSVFYDPLSPSPGKVDTTMNEVFVEKSFTKN